MALPRAPGCTRCSARRRRWARTAARGRRTTRPTRRRTWWATVRLSTWWADLARVEHVWSAEPDAREGQTSKVAIQHVGVCKRKQACCVPSNLCTGVTELRTKREDEAVRRLLVSLSDKRKSRASRFCSVLPAAGLYFAATSGVCLIRSGAAGFSKETTFATTTTKTRLEKTGTGKTVATGAELK
jgi:hypothetical protein